MPAAQVPLASATIRKPCSSQVELLLLPLFDHLWARISTRYRKESWHVVAFLLDAVLYRVTKHRNLALLVQAQHPSDCLVLDRRVPLWL